MSVTQICLKNWKLWRAPTTKELNIFYWNFAYVFFMPMSTKGVRNFFILSNIELLVKPSFYTLAFYIFVNNSRSKQNKKVPNKLL